MTSHHEKLDDMTIAFVGAGSIAEALIKGLTETGIGHATRLLVVNRHNPARLAYLEAQYDVIAGKDIRQAVVDADIILLCMKPKDIHEALPVIAAHARVDALYISVVAGYTIRSIQEMIACGNPLASTPRIVRTMPNTSCAVGKSATAYAMSDSCTARDRAYVEAILCSVGTSCTVDEHLLNAVTGLSGSGPAYVYYLVEALTLAGMDVGLDEQTSYSLVIQTLYGAAHMLTHTGESPAILRDRVTSPGGTTFAGISTLQQFGFEHAIRQAVVNATKRATELGDHSYPPTPSSK
ncbi:MAG: pyrroline-5-carboxylate reductase [Acidibacillus sp.]|nr:pyrroline-5-carboxylate reductase [Acidibacillus sp.]